MQFNILITSLIAALIPLIVGFLWYNQKTFGNAWMRAIGADENKLKENFNAPLVFGLTYIFSFFIAFALAPIVIHQFGFFGMLQRVLMINDTSAITFFKEGFATYGNEFRTFKHGMLHGSMVGVFIALPIIGINALFERRGLKYIAINAGYWILCLCLMGGIICQFAKIDVLFFLK